VSQLRHTFTGLSASTFYTATINAKRTSTDTHGECLIQCGGAGQTSSNVPHDNSWHTVSAIGRSDASGNLRIDFGFFVGFSFYPNDYAGNEWKAIFDGFSLAGPGLDPTDQPLQLGLEVVGQGSAILPTDIDLDSSIRTTLTVACVADASGEITVRFGCFGPA
jgi:hypothetical protein